MTPPIARFRLTWKTGSQPMSYESDKLRAVVGRAPQCEVVVRDERISRQHAQILFENGKWWVVDMGSANGTFVNSRHVTRQELKNGDLVLLGGAELRFEALGAVTGPEHRVIFKDEGGAAPPKRQYTAAINMAELKSFMATGLAPKKDDVSSLSSQAGTWVIGLFSQAAQTLVASRESQEMIEKVLDLVFKSLPSCERGFIGILDAGGEIEPRATRSRTNDSAETISISRTIANETIRTKQAVLIDDTQHDARFNQEDSILSMNIRSAMCAPLYNEGKVIGIIYIDSIRAVKPFTEQHLQVLSTLAMLLAMSLDQSRMRESLAREQQIRGHLERYMPPAVVNRIVASEGGEVAMHAEEKVVSVLFADLCGFTTMSETLPPTEVARILNSIFERLTEAIFDYEGVLDKYMGDAIMAFFGAPFAQPDHAERAVRAALLMQQRLDDVNEDLGLAKPVRMRIGINSGPVVAGDIGSPKRKEYTVIGDTVNVASRFESSVAMPGGIVIGATTYEMVKGSIVCEPLPPAKLKGKLEPVRAFLVSPTNALPRDTAP